MGDTTRFLSAISSPDLSDSRLNLPDEQLSPEELARKRRKCALSRRVAPAGLSRSHSEPPFEGRRGATQR